MAAGDRTAVFRAIGDFSRLVRESRKAKKEMGGLGDQTKKTGKDIDETGKKSEKSASRLTKLGKALQAPNEAIRKLKGSKFGDWLESVGKAGDRAGAKLKALRNGVAKISLIATAATAAAGPVLGLVGAVASLSGAVGVLPALMVSTKIAMAVLKVATLGVEDAFKAMGKPAAEFEEAIKDMPPSMQQAMRAMRGMKASVDNLRKGIQQKFWDGLAKPIKDLANVWFPILRRRGGDLAETFNHAAKEAAGFLANRKNADDLSGSLGNVNKFWDQMVGAVRPLLGVVRDVFAVSSEFLPGMSKGAAGAAKSFAAFIHEARESGKLKTWIRTGIDAVKDLGGVLGNVGRIFGGVFKAGNQNGAGFLKTLKEITGTAADWVNSTKGQDALGKIFKESAKAGRVLMPVVEALITNVAKIAPTLVKVGEAIAPGVTKLIDGIGTAIQHAEPQLVGLGAAIGDLLSAVGDAGPLLDVVVKIVLSAAGPFGVLADVIRFLTGLFEAMPQPMRDGIALIGGYGLAALAAAGLIAKLTKGTFGMLAVVGRAIGLLGKIPGLSKLATVGTALQTPDAKVKAKATARAKGELPSFDADADKKGKSAASRFVKALGRGIKAGGKGIATAVGLLFSGGSKAASGAATGLGKAFTWAKPALGVALRAIGTGVMFLAGAFRALGLALLTNPITWIVLAIAAAAYLIITNWSTVKAWIAAFFAWLGSAATAVWQWLVGIWNSIASATTTAWNAVVGAIRNAWSAVTGAVTSAARGVWSFLTGIWNGIVSGVRNAWSAVTAAVRNAWSAITGVVSGAVSGVLGFLGKVTGWLSSTWSSIWNGAVGVVRSVVNGIGNAIEWVVDVIKGAVDAIKTALSWIGDRISDVASGVSNAVSAINPANWFGQGGMVGGESGHKPIMAEQGEYLVPKGAALRWLPFLRAINPFDRGNLQVGMGDMLANVAGSAPGFGAGVGGAAAAFTAPASTSGVRDVNVTNIIHNPLPEKASESASRRTGRAAKLGVMSAIGGVA